MLKFCFCNGGKGLVRIWYVDLQPFTGHFVRKELHPCADLFNSNGPSRLLRL